MSTPRCSSPLRFAPPSNNTARTPHEHPDRDPAPARRTGRPAPMPRLGLDDLLQAVTDSGLTGRGGAGFPTAIKVRSVAAAGRKPVVVGNGMEGEPLSHKDAVLLDRNPHLVLDGLEVLARAMHAKRAILAIGPEIDPQPALDAARGRKVEVVQLAGGFIAGQETALVNQLDGRPALPRDPFTRVTESGVGRTADAGPQRRDPRPGRARGAARGGLVPLRRDAGRPRYVVVHRHRVRRACRGSSRPSGARTLREVLAAAQPVRPTAVLVGGYHGAWVPTSSLDVRLTRSELAPFNAAVGAGVLHVLDDGTCPLGFAAEVVDYLAQESAQQCGPCLNGLPHLAKNLHRLASGVRDRAAARRDRPDGRPGQGSWRLRPPRRQRALRRVDPRRVPRPRRRPPRRLVPEPGQEGLVKTRLHVDWTRCDGHGSCAELLPRAARRRRLRVPGVAFGRARPGRPGARRRGRAPRRPQLPADGAAAVRRRELRISGGTAAASTAGRPQPPGGRAG